MPRLFVAIDIPEPSKDPLTGFSRELPLARWVGREELHLTLRFIGEVDDNTFSLIRKGLSQVRFSPFLLRLCGVGHFPPGKHPRVLWVGMDQCEPLLRLQQQVEDALSESAIPSEERGFSPHITLARLKDTPPQAVLEFEKHHQDLASPAFEVREFVLYSSVLTPKGAIHTREEVYGCQ